MLAVNPVASLRLSQRFSVGAGLSLLYGQVELAAALPSAPPAPGGRVDLAGDGLSFAGNLALQFRAVPELITVAAHYRSRATLALDGNADFAPARPGFETIYPDQRASAELALPDQLSLGVELKPQRRVRVGLDVSVTRWSALERIVIDFERPSTPDRPTENASRDTLSTRVGVEWLLTKPELALRAGFLLEQASQPPGGLGPAMPDGRRVGGALGLGYRHGPWRLDVAYLHTRFLKALARATSELRRQSPDGTYSSALDSWALGISFEH